jgi:hypothetical protein
VAQVRPANTPVGTPPPVIAYAPEPKPTMLDGSAPPIAASAADALPMRRAAQPVAIAQPPAKVLATRGDVSAGVSPSQAKHPAKPAKVAHALARVRTAHAKPLPAPTAYTRPLSLTESDKPTPGKHKKVAIVKPVSEQGDGGPGVKPAVKAKPARVKAKPAKPAEAE